MEAYQARVLKEREELLTRHEALSRFIESEMFQELHYVEKGLLQRQCDIMRELLSVLAQRIALFK